MSPLPQAHPVVAEAVSALAPISDAQVARVAWLLSLPSAKPAAEPATQP